MVSRFVIAQPTESHRCDGRGDQVIMMDQDVDCFLESPAEFSKDSIWKREHMTNAEREALDEFIAGFKPK
jgi:hypothetical protein